MHNTDIPLKWLLAVKQAFGIDAEIELVRFFESKKNQVSSIKVVTDSESFEVCAKYYVWGNPDSEFTVLKKAYESGLNVPKPIVKLGSIVFSEPISGRRLGFPRTACCGRSVLLGRWLRDFHNKMTPSAVKDRVFLRGDCNLQNFLTDDDGSVWGVDFEQASFGSREEDLGELACSLIPKCADSFDKNAALNMISELLQGYEIKICGEKLLKVMKRTLEERLFYHPDRRAIFQESFDFLNECASEILDTVNFVSGKPACDEERWKKRYSKPKPPKDPEPFVRECASVLKPGKILDIACGEGRHSLFLASMFPESTVLGVDRSPEAVECCRQRACEMGLDNVSFQVLDLESEGLPEEQFDTIVVTRYWQESLCSEIIEHLAPEGCLIYETYTTEYLKYGPRHAAHLLSPLQLKKAFSVLKAEKYREYDRPQTREYCADLLAYKR